MIVKVLVENTKLDGYECEHGLSMFIEYKGKNYLVDTGASGLFAENAKVMGVDLSSVDLAFLSHAHFDHSGGYNEFFAVNDKAKVYLQKEAKAKYYFKIAGPVKKYIGIPEGILEKYSDRFSYVDGYMEVEDGVYILPHTTCNLEARGKHAHMYGVKDGVTTVDNFSHEQTVVFREEDGLVLFNSCSHGGVENIIEEVKAVFPGEKIKAFFGGFHMMGALGPETCSFSKDEVCAVGNQILDSSECVFYSGHCTGSIACGWLSEVLNDRFKELHSGLELVV